MKNIQAFPACDTKNNGYIPGMTLRDYFAGQALTGLLSNSNFIITFENLEKLSTRVYSIADAMLDYRDK